MSHRPPMRCLLRMYHSVPSVNDRTIHKIFIFWCVFWFVCFLLISFGKYLFLLNFSLSNHGNQKLKLKDKIQNKRESRWSIFISWKEVSLKMLLLKALCFLIWVLGACAFKLDIESHIINGIADADNTAFIVSLRTTILASFGLHHTFRRG